MCHIVEACPLTKLADDGLLQLHSTDDAAIKWLEDTAMKALAKWNELVYLVAALGNMTATFIYVCFGLSRLTKKGSYVLDCCRRSDDNAEISVDNERHRVATRCQEEAEANKIVQEI